MRKHFFHDDDGHCDQMSHKCVGRKFELKFNNFFSNSLCYESSFLLLNIEQD